MSFDRHQYRNSAALDAKQRKSAGPMRDRRLRREKEDEQAWKRGDFDTISIMTADGIDESDDES